MDAALCGGQHFVVKKYSFGGHLKNTGILHIHIQILDKGAKSTNGERIVSATNGVGKNG